MQDDRIEHKIVVEANSPRVEDESQRALQVPQPPGLLSMLYGFVSPRGQSPSPASRQMEEQQQQEIKQHKEEIRRLKEEVITKKNELNERIAEIAREREERHRDRELQRELAVAAPPDYTGSQSLIIHPPADPEEKLSAENLPELSIPHSEPEQTNDDSSVFDAAADELLESKLSTESSQQRFNEERIAQQQQQIDELNQEIGRLQQETNERLRKEAEEVARLNQALEQERKRAAETLENERLKFEEIMQARNRAYIEEREITRAELEEANRLIAEERRINQARVQADLIRQQDLNRTQQIIIDERRQRAQADLLRQQENEEIARAQKQAAEKIERDRKASERALAKDISSMGL